jgi:TolA-binding protein
MPEPKNDVEKELGEIKREVIEGRNLVIKTDNLLKSLHAELKAVGKKQEEFERRKLVSSGVAYGLFAALCVAGTVAITSARGASVSGERERFDKTVKELTEKIEVQKKDAQERASTATKAFEVYRMMTERPGDERLAGVEAWAKMDTQKLTPLERSALKDRAESLRVEMGQAAFERGKLAFRKNDMGETVKEMTRFVAMNPAPEDAADAAFFLGIAYNQLRQHELAVQHLSQFVASDRKSKTRDYAMLMLAQSYEQTGALEKAARTVQEALAQHPNSEFAAQLRGRLATVRRAMGQAGESTPGPAPAAAPAAAPAPAPKPTAAGVPAAAAAPAP